MYTSFPDYPSPSFKPNTQYAARDHVSGPKRQAQRLQQLGLLKEPFLSYHAASRPSSQIPPEADQRPQAASPGGPARRRGPVHFLRTPAVPPPAPHALATQTPKNVPDPFNSRSEGMANTQQAGQGNVTNARTEAQTGGIPSRSEGMGNTR